MTDPDTAGATAEVVRLLWERMEAREWDAARATLADDLVVEYVHTGERFVGGDRHRHEPGVPGGLAHDRR